MRKSFFLLWIGIVALLLFFWIYFPTLSKYRDLKIQEENIQKEIDSLDAKIKDLKEERGLLKNDEEYLEKVIRDELGLVRPGEVVYKFVEDKPAVSKPAKTVEVPAPSAAEVKTVEAVSSVAALQEKIPVTPIAPKLPSKPVLLVEPVKRVKVSQLAAQPVKEYPARPAYPRQETR